MDPLQYGYCRDVVSKCLLPVTVPENVSLAPPEILKLVKCSIVHLNAKYLVKTTNVAATAKLPCTIFCSCHSVGCNIVLTQSIISDDDDENVNEGVDTVVSSDEA